MKTDEILKKLQAMSNERLAKSAKKRLISIDAYGVKMGDIRKLSKTIQNNSSLSIALFDTNIIEAKMLATLIMPFEETTYDLLTDWAKSLESSNIVDQGLARLVNNSPFYEKALNSWYKDTNPNIRYAGYSLFSSYFNSYPLDKLDYDLSSHILSTIETTILNEPSTIQNAMNNAVVMAGLNVPKLVDKAISVAEQIGYILPLRAKNSCNIQSASDYITRYSSQPKFSRVAKLKSTQNL